MLWENRLDFPEPATVHSSRRSRRCVPEHRANGTLENRESLRCSRNQVGIVCVPQTFLSVSVLLFLGLRTLGVSSLKSRPAFGRFLRFPQRRAVAGFSGCI